MHDIFIAHSRNDEQPVRGLARRLREGGFDVDVDFGDPALKKPADRAWGDRLKERIAGSRILLFVVSATSANSKWTPWMLGLAQGMAGSVVLWPLDDGAKWTPRAREYLGLYETVDPAGAEELLGNLVGQARSAAVAAAKVEPPAAPEPETAVTAQPDQSAAFMEFAVNRPAQLYMAWLNALMGKR